jgi:hypothetical protein
MTCHNSCQARQFVLDSFFKRNAFVAGWNITELTDSAVSIPLVSFPSVHNSFDGK